jgi:hypothetical protein
MRYFCLAALLLALSCSDSATPRTLGSPFTRMAPVHDPAEVLALLPADTTILARIASVAKLERAYERLNGILEIPLPLTPIQVLSGAVGIDPAAIKTDRPLYIALAIAKNRPPRMTLVAPVANPAKQAAVHRGGGSAFTDGYVALSQSTTYKRGGTPLTEEMVGGTLSLRFDAGKLFDEHPDWVENVLGTIEQIATAAGGGALAPGFDGNQLRLASILAVTRRLDLSLTEWNGSFDLQMAARVEGDVPKSRSALDLGRFLPKGTSLQVLSTSHGNLLLDLARAFGTPGALPEYDQQMKKATALLLGRWAAGLAFNEAGMRAAYVAECADSAAFVQHYTAALRSPELTELGMRIEAAKGSLRLFLPRDPSQAVFLDMFRHALVPETGLSVDMAAHDGRVCIAFGDAAWLGATEGAEAPTSIDGTVTHHISIDLRETWRGIADAVHRRYPDTRVGQYRSGVPVPASLTIATDRHTYRARLRIDLASAKNFFDSAEY